MIEIPGSFWKDYELLDSGRGEKLERFGHTVLIRPEPKALWKKTLPDAEWRKLAHFAFRLQRGWALMNIQELQSKKQDDLFYFVGNDAVESEKIIAP